MKKTLFIFAAPVFLALPMFLLTTCAGSNIPLDMLKTAALMSGCPGSDYRDGIGSAIHLMTIYEGYHIRYTDSVSAVYMGFINCAKNTSTCDAFLPCVKPTPQQAALCTDGVQSVCLNGTLINCDPSVYLGVEFCMDVGLACITEGNSAQCGYSICTTKMQPAYNFCAGNQLLFDCENVQPDVNGAWILTDCFRLGGVCVGVDPEPSICQGQGADCTGDLEQCSGTNIQQCLNGKISSIDCSTLDPSFICVIGEDQHAGCYSVPVTCDQNFSETCSGSVISFCQLGNIATLDCSDYGFTGCGVQSAGSHNIAFCKP